MWKLLAVGIGLGHQAARYVELEVIAVGGDQGIGEAPVLIAARPVEGWHEDDLFFRVALRAIETGGRLGLAEDVSNAVIADAVAGAEVVVSVVVEGAPADAAGVLRVGGQLIVDTRVADGVLAEAFDVVDGLGGIHVAVKFGVEIERMIGRPEREAEVVHGEDVFKQL